MSPEAQFVAAMQADVDVIALVDDRLFGYVADPDTALPLIVYERTSSEPKTTIHSSVPFATQSVLSVSCWADQRADAEALADQVQIAMSQVGTPTNRFGHFDPEVDAHAAVVDFEIWDA